MARSPDSQVSQVAGPNVEKFGGFHSHGSMAFPKLKRCEAVGSKASLGDIYCLVYGTLRFRFHLLLQWQVGLEQYLIRFCRRWKFYLCSSAKRRCECCEDAWKRRPVSGHEETDAKNNFSICTYSYTIKYISHISYIFMNIYIYNRYTYIFIILYAHYHCRLWTVNVFA